jgi:hypothetical protein
MLPLRAIAPQCSAGLGHSIACPWPSQQAYQAMLRMDNGDGSCVVAKCLSLKLGEDFPLA